MLPQARVVILVLVWCGVAAALAPKYADAMKYAIGACPCEDRANCALIRGARKEIHAMAYGSDWKTFDLSAITSISVYGLAVDPELVCMAHSKGARVLMRVHLESGAVLDPSQRGEWIVNHVNWIARNRVDGIHLDIDTESLKHDGITTQLADAIQELKKEMFERVASSRVVVSLPWSPLGIDGRIHAVSPIAMAADYVFVVADDMRTQFVDRCVASHSGSLNRIRSGVLNYLDLNVPRAKLILALAWQAYDYECEKGTAPDAPVCLIKTTNATECSDHLATRVDLDRVILANVTQTSQGMDAITQSAYYNYLDGSAVHQVWFDNMDTLRAKYEIAADLGLAGVGVTSILSRHPEIQSSLLRSLSL